MCPPLQHVQQFELIDNVGSLECWHRTRLLLQQHRMAPTVLCTSCPLPPSALRLRCTPPPTKQTPLRGARQAPEFRSTSRGLHCSLTWVQIGDMAEFTIQEA